MKIVPFDEVRPMHHKIVYWGAPGAGRSTNLRCISHALGESRLDAVNELQLEVTPEYSVRLVKANPSEGETPFSTDGQFDTNAVVFVVDTSPARHVTTRAAAVELQRLYRDVPVIVQWNKSDLCEAKDLDLMRAMLGTIVPVEEIEAVAPSGLGVVPTLKAAFSAALRVQFGVDPRDHETVTPAERARLN